VFRHPPQRCARARECVSLELDGELSRLELARLRRHLERCVDCRSFATTVEGVAGALRAAPFEPLPRPTPVPHRVRGRLSRPLVRLAAPALAAVAVVAVAAPTLSRDSRDRLLRPSPASLEREVDAMRAYQRELRTLQLEHALGPSTRSFQRPPGMDVSLTR